MSDGAHTTTTSQIADDPVTQACQKNFVIIVTDGEPTNDAFDLSGTLTTGFSSFGNLVGDYAPDAVGDADIGTDGTPEVGIPPWGSTEGAGYLDDIALFMQENDCRSGSPCRARSSSTSTRSASRRSARSTRCCARRPKTATASTSRATRRRP